MDRPGIRAAATFGVVAALASAAVAADPPPFEPVRVETVPVPEGVLSMVQPKWTPDGGHILVEFTSTDEPRDQLAVMAVDGSGFRCLTCGLDQVLGPDRPFNTLEPLDIGKPFVFGDGKRVLARIPSRSDRQSVNPLSGPTSDFNYVILECEPSLLDCEARQLLPLRLPGELPDVGVDTPTGGLVRGVQNREGRISPDGSHFAWTEVRGDDGARMTIARLVRRESDYTVEDPRVLNPPFDVGSLPLEPGGTHADWEAAGPLYELKQFGDGGRSVTYAAAGSASNFDVWELDLESGARRRVTTHLDWDEDAQASPDGNWMAMFRGRGLDRMRVWSQLERPEILEWVTFPQIGRYMLTEANRKCLIEPWLVDREGDRPDGYGGQPLNPTLEEGWSSSPTVEWSPDGTAVLFWEDAVDHEAREALGLPVSRLRIARLPGRAPAPDPAAPFTPHPEWAPTSGEWQAIGDEQVLFHTIAAPHSGAATLTWLGNFAIGSWQVTYDAWSDDGRSFVSGIERVSTPNPIVFADYEVDLVLTGEHEGGMRGRIQVQAGGGARGTIASSVDGDEVEGLPTPEDCPPLGPVPLEGAIVSSLPGDDGSTLVTVEVTARVPADPASRPVRHVTVRSTIDEAFTDDAGRATVRVPEGAAAIELLADGFTAEIVDLPSP